MESLPRRRTTVLLAMVLLFGVILLGAWIRPASSTKKPDANTAHQDTSPATANLSRQLDGDEEYRAEIDALFGPIRKQMRAARETPDVNALLAFAEADLRRDPLAQMESEDGKVSPLSAAVVAMTSDQCFSIFQELLATRSGSDNGLPDARSSVLGQLWKSLLSRDIKDESETLARWLADEASQLPKLEEARPYLSGAVVAWGKSDPKAAANFALSLAFIAKDSWDVPLLREVCDGWGKIDPQDALAWAKNLSDADTQKVYALAGVFGYFNEFDAEEAKGCVVKLLGVNQDKAASELAAQVTGEIAQRHTGDAEGPLAVAQWALSLPGMAARSLALQQVTDVWVGFPDKWPQAVQWAGSLPPDETRGAVWASVAISWEASGILSFAGGTPEFFERLKVNENTANVWLNTLPEGPDRDNATVARDQWLDTIRRQRIWR